MAEQSRWIRLHRTRAIAAKDLRVELRGRVLINQVIPFSVLVLVLFGFAVDDDGIAQRVAPGLIWMATLFSLLVMVQRTFAVEAADGALDSLRVAGVDPTVIFWGKAMALAVQLAVLELVLFAAAIILFAPTLRLSGVALLVATWIVSTAGLALVGTLYGGLTAGIQGRESLLPLLVFPVVAPVLIGATRAVESGLGTTGAAVSEGWPWIGLLTVFGAAFAAGGTLAFGPLIDD
ncbi:MAG: heme exporter protein CcmB [Actinomycetota bacterium]|nr:heme exporter protein CcmB [Actinomycetota bacterium]